MTLIINRQFYTLKFSSSKLKELGYSIITTFDESLLLGEVIALADSQMLRSIRSIRKHTVDKEKLERLYAERKQLRKRCEKRRHCAIYVDRLKWIKDKINRTMFIPDYVTVVMEHPKHYEAIFTNGIYVNGKKYERFSCSAGQARVSTVVLCASEIIPELERRLNNGRDMTKKTAPSKFNAYFGLAGSATKEVSEPRFIVVKDYENTVKFMANFVTEKDWDIDDEVDQREVEVAMNRTDGMGLVSPAQSQKWAKELELDYTPSQWIVRQSFLKGMVCTFDFHLFCEEVNGGNYLVDTIYQDENGVYIKADLRDVDMIVSESQFKLWDSWSSVKKYVECCHENGLTWGVVQYSPKELKRVLTLNYQFLQTLNLGKREIEEVCEQFVDWISGVSFKDRAYMLLFLLGVENTNESIERFLKSSDKWWIKALVVNEKVQNDPFIRKKIRELTVKRVQNACLGEIWVSGNFQTMVSDPYAYAEYVCGLSPKGLLGAGEFYSRFWNDRGAMELDTMRSPMTYRSEHVIAKLVKNERTEKWYRYCGSGYIMNWYDNASVRYAGCDCDGDLVASTDNQAMIRSIYRNELPVVYDVPKPKKIVFEKQDLYSSDLFSFGSIIGSITNKGSNAYALLPVLIEKFGTQSDEVRLCMSRLQQCCSAQSRQIDKAKIGQKVKGIPNAWTKRQHISEDDTPDAVRYKELMNHTLIERKPYFFKYRYTDTKREFYTYEAQKQSSCKANFGMTIKQLEERPRKTPEQRKWLEDYYEFAPLIMSDSPMNLLCKYIESVDFEIIKSKPVEQFDWCAYIDPSVAYEDEYADVIKCYKRHLKDVAHMKIRIAEDDSNVSKNDAYLASIASLKEKMRYICSNPKVITNALVWYLYEEAPSSKKDLLWDAYGRYMVSAAMGTDRESKAITFPLESENGSVEYLGRKYEWTEVKLDG